MYPVPLVPTIYRGPQPLYGPPVNLQLNPVDRFVEGVRKEFEGHPEHYHVFERIMRDCFTGVIGLPDVIERIMILFRRHPELICGFNIFLVLVDCRMDYKREPCGGRFITVKTSNESIQFSTEKLRELHDTILAPYYRQPLHLPSSTGTLVGSVSQEVKTGIVGAVAGDRMCKRHNVRSDHENRRKLEDNPLYLEITKRHKDMLERDTPRYHVRKLLENAVSLPERSIGPNRFLMRAPVYNPFHV